MLVVQVFIMRDGAFEGTEMLQGDRCELGSDPQCGLVLDDESCSRRHAVLSVRDGKLSILDLGSASGTRVNGEVVTTARVLGPRDDVAIGVFTLKVKLMSAAARVSAPPVSAAADATRSLSAPSAAQLQWWLGPHPLLSREDGAAAPPSVAALADAERTDVHELTAPDGLLLAPPTTHKATVSEAVRAAQQPRPPEDSPLPGALPMLSFAPWLEDDLPDDDSQQVPWSLVQQLVQPGSSEGKGGKATGALIEVVHYRGELVLDHQVLCVGQTFKLFDRMTRAQRRERGVRKAIPLVRLKQGGVAEIFSRPEVSGALLRGAEQLELSSQEGAVPITDGELARLQVGDERIFVRFAGPPQLVWTKNDTAEALFARRLNRVAVGASVGLFALLALASWIYQYRSADEEIIAIDDIGFAEVEMKDLKMEEPPPEPEKAPAPAPASVERKVDQAVAAPKTEAVPQTAPNKPGVLDILNNIPKVNDKAASQNLSAALSNIKGVRVPGGVEGVKVSALIGKGPASGVQIGGAAGGLSTSGINSILRKEGQAGALGGKSDRAIAGKATAQPRLLKQTGGALSKDEIQKVINQHIGEIQYCYEKQLRTQPGLAGRVVFEWTVGLSGKVTVVKIAQWTLASSEATSCMMSKLETWKFPSPRGGAVSITFPFVFNTV